MSHEVTETALWAEVTRLYCCTCFNPSSKFTMSKFARDQLHSNCNLLWFGLLGILLEHAELLSTSVVLCLNIHNIETHCFGEGSALSNCCNISFLNSEAGWAVSWDILVAFLKSVVFLEIVKIVPSNNNGSLHLCWNNSSSENTSTNAYVASEWALLVNVCSIYGFLGCFESQSNGLGVSDTLSNFLSKNSLLVQENATLLLKSFLCLCSYFNRHCDDSL